MTEAVVEPAESLRRRLAAAAADRFAGVGELDAAGLLESLDGLLAEAPPAADDWAALRATLADWAGLRPAARAAAVARGLRLVRTHFGPPRSTAVPAPEPRAGASRLDESTRSLPGIGPALAMRLSEHGLDTVADLVWMVPRGYDDVRRVTPLGELDRRVLGDRVAVRATVSSCRFFRKGPRRWVDLRIEDGGQSIVIRWFGGHASMVERFPRGAIVAVSARVTERSGQLEMANPDVLEIVTPDGQRKGEDRRILSRYRELPGVPGATLRKAIRAAVDGGLQEIRGAVPDSVLQRLDLPPLGESLERLHDPPESLSVDEVGTLCAQDSPWHRRLAFEEMFLLGLVVARRRMLASGDVAPKCPRAEGLTDDIEAALPFELTRAQRRVIDEIGADLDAETPMNRLLQGDVGSGKTAVAFAAATQVARAGRQAAVMAPTEILAEQHFRSLSGWCAALGLRCAHLTASTPRGVRASTLALLGAGQIDVVVGTHALLGDDVAFADLALAVIDEQHRFGVAQRVALRSKGQDGSPHLLVMTATPIPRTLAMSAYGDLDVSVLDELPPGREPPATRVLPGRSGRAEAYKELRARLRAGARAYLVCPMVEPGEDSTADWADTQTASAAIAEKWPEVKVAVVHGRMSTDERDDAMARFRSGDAQLLVATTVIEVGVDVPEATVMLVEDADRFGLSQLHQLRGRVGRGGGDSLCLLVTRGGPTADGAQRLQVMGQTGDGFAIAEADLDIRGPGELLGTKQAGLPKLRFGDLVRHTELLRLARGEAERLLRIDPDLERPEHAAARAAVAAAAVTEVYGAESG